MRLSLVCAQRLCIVVSQVRTTQSGRETPTKGSYSSLHVVITQKQLSVWCEHSLYLIFFNIFSCFNNELFLVA